MSATPHFDVSRTLRRWDIRRRILESIIWIPRGLLAGVLVGLVVAIISRLRPWLLKEEIMLVAGAASGVSLFLTLFVVWLYPRSSLWLARHFDTRFGLKERLSTAVELESGRIPPARDLADYQFSDTRWTAERVNLRQVLPIQPKWADWALLVVAVGGLALLLLVENKYTDAILTNREIDAALNEQIEELENTREEILNDESLSEAEKQELLQPIDEALDTLSEPDVSREEAVAALSEAEQQLREQSDGFTEEEDAAFEEAGDALGESDLTEDAGESLSEGALSQSADDLREAGEELSEGGTSAQDNEALAEQLERAADALQSVSPDAAEALREAADALREGDLEAAQDALERAASALDQQESEAGNRNQAQAADQAADDVEGSRQQVAQAGQPRQFGEQSSQSQQGQQGQPSGDQSQQGEGQQPGSQSQQGEGQQPGSQSGEGQSGNSGASSGQSGQNQGNQQGSSGQAQSGGTGQENQSGGAAAGEGIGGDGTDTTSGTQGSGNPIESDNRPGENEGLRDYDTIFAPSRVGEDENENQVQVDGDPQGDDSIDEREGDFNEEFDAESRVTYDSVYADYADSVNQALDTDYIPIGMKDVIRNYFSSLEP